MTVRPAGGKACDVAPAPSEFRALVVESTDTLAVAFVKVFIRFPVLLYRWFITWIAADGTLTPEFKAKICAACPEEEIT